MSTYYLHQVKIFIYLKLKTFRAKPQNLTKLHKIVNFRPIPVTLNEHLVSFDRPVAPAAVSRLETKLTQQRGPIS